MRGRSATRVDKTEHDTFGQFLDECVEMSVGEETSARVLYDAYTSWREAMSDPRPCSPTIFGSRLLERDFQKKRKSTGNVYLDVMLKGPGSNDWDEEC